MSEILEIFEGVLRKLDGAGIAHMVVGSVASIVYGGRTFEGCWRRPRWTGRIWTNGWIAWD